MYSRYGHTYSRKQRRVNGKKVNYYVCNETGKEYDTKPERKMRSDKQCISDNNIVPVVYRLIMQDGDRLQGTIDNTADVQLFCDTCYAVSDLLFLIYNCTASYGMWIEVQDKARRICHKFLYRFYPGERENESNKDVLPLRYLRPDTMSRSSEGYDGLV